MSHRSPIWSLKTIKDRQNTLPPQKLEPIKQNLEDLIVHSSKNHINIKVN